MLKYQKIAKNIEDYIRDNKMKQGDKLPVLEELVVHFEAGKSTVRRSLALLESQGLVYQQHGSGIFVRTPKEKDYMDLTFNRGFAYEFSDYEVTYEVLSVETKEAPPEVVEFLNIRPTDLVHYVKRLIRTDGKPTVIEESCYAASVIPHIDEQIANESIFTHLKEVLKIRFGFSESYLVVEKLSKDEAKLLKLRSGDPRPCKITTFYLSDRTPFNYSKTIFHYKQSKFFIPIVKNY